METTKLIGLLVVNLIAGTSTNCYDGCTCTWTTYPDALSVNCTRARLGCIPQDILENAYLLIISDDNIPQLKQHTFNYVSAATLHILSLQKNNISKIEPNAFFGLTNLEILYLSQNSIEKLSSKVFHGLNNVKNLSLSDNKIITVDPAAFEGMENLLSLRLSGNHIQMLSPDTFSKNLKLRELYLNHNLLSLLTDTSFLQSTSLRVLNMSHCQLNEVPPTAFKETPKLQIIDLGSNDLMNISFSFHSLMDLRVLNLEENEILVLEESTFRDLPNLEILLLDGNRIHKLHKNVFQQNTKITKLTLHNNYISTLDKEIVKSLVDLVQLDMHSNPLKCDCKLQTTYIWCLNKNVTTNAECRHPNGSYIPWSYVGYLTCIGDKPITQNHNNRPLVHQKPLSDLKNDVLHISSWNMYILIVICILVFILFAICFAYFRRRYRGTSTPNFYDVAAARKAGGTYTNFQMGEVTSVVMNSKALRLSGNTSLHSTLSSRYSRSPVTTTERHSKNLTP